MFEIEADGYKDRRGPDACERWNCSFQPGLARHVAPKSHLQRSATRTDSHLGSELSREANAIRKLRHICRGPDR
jgi:hypothetical protein